MGFEPLAFLTSPCLSRARGYSLGARKYILKRGLHSSIMAQQILKFDPTPRKGLSPKASQIPILF